MKFIIGGRQFDLTEELVIASMEDQDAELVREWLVELPNGWFPPKQILATVTGVSRGSFTTQEATRVLSRLGFPCRRQDEARIGAETSQTNSTESTKVSVDDRLSEISSAIKVLQVALASISDRVIALEGMR